MAGDPQDEIEGSRLREAIAEISQSVAAFKGGWQTVAWALPGLLRPQ